MISRVSCIGRGAVNGNTLSSTYLSFREIFKNEDRDFLHPGTRSPRTPPPFVSNFAEKKLTPIFFLEIESLIAKTNFTLGPIEKSIFFSSVIMLYFSIN